MPIGFIYTQFPNRPEPSLIWPQVTWTNRTTDYSGLFFRADGGDSEKFGVIQDDNSPKINRVEWVQAQDANPYPTFTELPKQGWSSWVQSAYNEILSGQWLTSWRYKLRFHTTGGEVRPKNTAVRLWKRTA